MAGRWFPAHLDGVVLLEDSRRLVRVEELVPGGVGIEGAVRSGERGEALPARRRARCACTRRVSDPTTGATEATEVTEGGAREGWPSSARSVVCSARVRGELNTAFTEKKSRSASDTAG